MYLVSDAFETTIRIPLVRDGVPILGMEKFVQRDPALVSRLGTDWVQAPNTAAIGSPNACGARHRGDFHSDPATLQATLARILGGDAAATTRARSTIMRRHASATTLVAQRRGLEIASRR